MKINHKTKQALLRKVMKARTRVQALNRQLKNRLVAAAVDIKQSPLMKKLSRLKKKNGIIKHQGVFQMKEISQNTELEKRSNALTGQTHDLRSLWNYFFDFGSDNMDRLEPKINVTEEKDSVLVVAEVPGIKEENLDIKISDDGYLTIAGQKEQDKELASQNSYFQEISYGMFKRTIPLPFDLDYNMANADYDNGVLNIHIPKSKVQKQKFKKISVKKKGTQPEQNFQA